MSMTIKNVINKYVCPSASLPLFDSFMNNGTATARDLKAAARMAGEEIAVRAEWTQMYKTTTIAAATSSSTLPADYHRLIHGNAIFLNQSPWTPIPYIRAADIWAQANELASDQPYFSIKNGAFKFLPALTAEARVRYITKNWLTTAGEETDELTTDDDIPLISHQLLALGILYRYKRAMGLAYQDLADEFEARFDTELRADRGLT